MKSFKDKIKNNEILGPLAALLIMTIALAFLSDNFMTYANILNLLRQVSVNIFIAFAMTFVILTGGIDLSVGSTLALTSALTAGLITSGMNPFVCLILGLLIGGLLGLINGVFISMGNLAPFIVTLATMSIYRGFTLVYTNGNPITGVAKEGIFKFLGRGSVLGIPFPIIIMIIIFVILYIFLHRTPFGRKIFATGGNEKAALISGISINKIKIFVYTISGVLSAISGLILMSRLNSAQPTSGVGAEMDAIAAVVLGGTSMVGGKGSLYGTLVGALIIGVLNNGLNIIGVSSFYQQVAKGVVILLAVLLDSYKNRKK